MFLKFHSLFIMRARILNPQILLADHTVVTGPAFYDTAQRPHFFPLNAVIVNLLPFSLPTMVRQRKFISVHF